MCSATGLWLIERAVGSGRWLLIIPNILFFSKAVHSVERADADADFHHRRVFGIWEGRREIFELVTSHAKITIIIVIIIIRTVVYILLNNNNIRVYKRRTQIKYNRIVYLCCSCDRLIRVRNVFTGSLAKKHNTPLQLSSWKVEWFNISIIWCRRFRTTLWYYV